jgi:hypothetical protein
MTKHLRWPQAAKQVAERLDFPELTLVTLVIDSMSVSRMGHSVRLVVPSENVPTLTKIHLERFLRVQMNQTIWRDSIILDVLSNTGVLNLKSFKSGNLARGIKDVDGDLDEVSFLAADIVMK